MYGELGFKKPHRYIASLALGKMSTFAIATMNRYEVLGESMSDNEEYDESGAPFDEHLGVYDESGVPFDEHLLVYEEESNQFFDWEALDGKETEWGNHGSPFDETIGKPFGDATNPLFDWEDLEKKDEECRMKENEAKMEARGWG